MPYEANFIMYHQSISNEMKATQDRIRNLIGSSHWLTDGEHKEAVLRKILRSHLPEKYKVGKGFICYEKYSSTQLDILISSKSKPTLFKDGDLLILTPDCVKAIIEVKTSQSSSELRKTFKKLADQLEKIRRAGNSCWAGVFIYDEYDNINKILHALYDAADEKKERVINFVASGPRIFVRFWENGDVVNNPIGRFPVWHLYKFSGEILNGMAQAYFISNIVMSLSTSGDERSEYAWFPIDEIGGKEAYRKKFICLNSRTVIDF